MRVATQLKELITGWFRIRAADVDSYYAYSDETPLSPVQESLGIFHRVDVSIMEAGEHGLDLIHGHLSAKSKSQRGTPGWLEKSRRRKDFIGPSHVFTAMGLLPSTDTKRMVYYDDIRRVGGKRAKNKASFEARLDREIARIRSTAYDVNGDESDDLFGDNTADSLASLPRQLVLETRIKYRGSNTAASKKERSDGGPISERLTAEVDHCIFSCAFISFDYLS
jgi:hypothetical protein